MQLMTNFVYLIVIVFVLYGYTATRRVRLLPTYTFLYPDNEEESKRVYAEMLRRTREMEDFFYLTDESVSYAFTKVVDRSIDELDSIFAPYTLLIMFLKYLINRARPAQVNSNVRRLELKSISADSPALPSGHSFQAFILAKVLSEEYPSKKEILYNTAERCGHARIIAGLHYPSDHELSKNIVAMLPL